MFISYAYVMNTYPHSQFYYDNDRPYEMIHDRQYIFHYCQNRFVYASVKSL